jgi:cysteine synthase A
MIHRSIVSCIGAIPLAYLHKLFPRDNLEVLAKLEFLNPGGSVKDRPARFILEEGLRTGTIRSTAHLIESTSGNLGIARASGLALTCVVDPRTTASNLCLLKEPGARVELVHAPDDQGGYLKTRTRRVQQLQQSIPNGYWINQYANQLNWNAHYYGTAAEIAGPGGAT